jgi:hypothetical protein
MPRSQLEQVDGALAGAWIKPALESDWGGRVKNLVPQIYEAYARIFHPAHDEEGNEVTWEEVTRRLGTVAHREMQWHAIVGSWDPTGFTDSRWSGGDPYPGDLVEEKIDLLCGILARHTGTPESTYFGMSTIHAGVRDEWPDAPQYEQHARDWVVLRGPLAAVDQIAVSDRHPGIAVLHFYPKGQAPPPDYEPPEQWRRQTPDLIWPEDRSWFVQTEVDFDSTVVGGSRALIDALLGAPELEVWEVDGEVSLTEDADKLNLVPDPPPGAREPQDPKVLTREGFAEHLGMLSGTVTAVSTDLGILALEVGGPGPGAWSVIAEHSTRSAGDAADLIGATVQRVEVDPQTDALLLHIADRPAFEVRPLPREDDDPPSWRVRTPFGITLKHGPELLYEFRGEWASIWQSARSAPSACCCGSFETRTSIGWPRGRPCPRWRGTCTGSRRRAPRSSRCWRNGERRRGSRRTTTW